MSVVLQCPVCSASFQVAPDQAGQLVACPTCEQTVAVPANIEIVESVAKPTQQEVFGCPKCSGKFGVTQEMKGTEVACPHCDAHVSIKPDSSKMPPQNLRESSPDSGPPNAPIKIRTGKKKKKRVIDIPGTSPQSKNPVAKPDDMLPPKAARMKTKPKADIPKPDVMSQAKSNAGSKPVSKTPQPPAPPSPRPSKQKSAKPSVKSEAGKRVNPQPPPKKESLSNSETRTKPTTGSSSQSTNSDKETTSVEVELANPIDRRLPPKFTAVDPDELFSATAREQNHKVILPDGDGGYQRLDSRVVHVERDGKKVQLYSAPKEKKERKRFMQNLIAILIGIVVLAAVFYFLVAW